MQIAYTTPSYLFSFRGFSSRELNTTSATQPGLLSLCSFRSSSTPVGIVVAKVRFRAVELSARRAAQYRICRCWDRRRREESLARGRILALIEHRRRAWRRWWNTSLLCHLLCLRPFQGFGPAPAISSASAKRTHTPRTVLVLTFSSPCISFCRCFFFVESSQSYMSAIVVHLDFYRHRRRCHIVSATSTLHSVFLGRGAHGRNRRRCRGSSRYNRPVASATTTVVTASR